MASVRASAYGLVEIDRAIARKGWKKSSDTPLLEASRILEPDKNWQELELYAYGCSRQTWERFLRGIPIRDRSFRAFCQVLGINADNVIETNSYIKEDWGAAPDVPAFHGRQQELATLERWIVKERNKAIAIVGLGGIGKTSLVRGGIGKTDLSLRLAQQIRGEFDCLIWRRLLNAPPAEILIAELIEFVSDRQETKLANTIDGLVTQLLQYLKQRRCLLILDNVESILQSGENTGDYRSDYEGYKELCQRLGRSEHQSCLLLTSRIKPRDIEDLEGLHKVRSLELKGLDIAAGKAIFDDLARTYNTNFLGTDREWQKLITFYSGNPLALEVVARHILRRFEGKIADFLNHSLMVFGRIRDLLDWHFARLSPAEKNIMYWLTLNHEAVSIAELKADLVSSTEAKYLPETLDILERQIPLEKNQDCFTLQPVLIEYISERIIDRVSQELASGRLQLFNSHALIKASAKDYVKDSQIRLILQPIIDRLNRASLVSGDALKNYLDKLLSNLNRQLPGYATGNIINLMRYAKIDLAEYDFSQLTIWQADLQNLELHGVNFTGCQFANCSLTQDFGGIHAIALSPDGEILAGGDSQGKIYLYRVRDRQRLLCLEGHLANTWISSLAFSPDGALLASSSLDYDVKIWDITTGQCCQTFKGHQQWVWSVAFSPDGALLASGSDDNTVRIWHLATGEYRVLASNNRVWAVAFNSQGNILATAGFDRTVRLWDVATGSCLKILQGHQAAVWSVAFSADGTLLASGSADKTIKLWDVETGKSWHTLKGHNREVRSIAFGAGNLLISGSFDCTVRMWDTVTGNLLKTLIGHADQIWTVAANSKTDIIASGDKSQIIKFWSCESKKCLKTLRGYANWMWAIAISPDGQLIASGSLDKIVRLWNVDGKVTATLKGHQNMIWAVKFSPDGKLLASCGDDGCIRLWDINTGQCSNAWQDSTQRGIWTLDFSPDGQLLISGGTNGLIQVWDTLTGNLIRSIEAHNTWIWSVTSSTDNRYIASCSKDSTIKLWDVNTGSCSSCIQDNLNNFMSIAFSPDCQMLVSGDEDSHVQLWEIETGRCLRSFLGHTDSVWAIAFINERTFASASADCTIRFWDIDTGKCIKVLTGHTAWVRGIALSTDGQILVSSSTDGTICLWDIERQIQQVLRPKKPYEEMNIADTKGLTTAQKQALIALGANDR